MKINLNFGIFRPATRKLTVTADSEGLEALKEALDKANYSPEGTSTVTIEDREGRNAWIFEIARKNP